MLENLFKYDEDIAVIWEYSDKFWLVLIPSPFTGKKDLLSLKK